MIGGSGERQTLKIVAKYADACNLFGSPETIKRKLAVLREHCRSVGRDYDSIMETKLAFAIIDNDRQRLQKSLEEELGGMPESSRREFAVYGTPDEVRRQVEAFREAEIQYLILNFEPRRELEAVKLFADEFVKAF